MGHGHGHGAASAGGQHRRPLAIAFVLTAVFMVVEIATGLLTGSLALLSDGAHMATDVLGLGMSLAAITLAARPATSQRSFGFYRLEVLAALANGVLLFGVAVYVLVEAARRLADPPVVASVPLLVVAVVGLVVNVISFRLLTAGAGESLNIRGARLEVLGDMLGSVGVIVAAVVIATTGWGYADPIIGAAIGVFILPRTWVLSRQAVHILMQAAPAGVDVEQVAQRIGGLAGVVEVHDLHVWTLTSGMDTASGHVRVADGFDYHEVLDRVLALLADDYGVVHTTIQCEPAHHTDRPSAI
ncbi:MAG: cation diffusion facilitator family transporter [Mycobacteriaceae bacterium]